VTFNTPEYGDGMYILLLQRGNGSAVVTAAHNNITGTKSIASPNLTDNGYDMVDIYLVTPGASPAGTSTPGPTIVPGDISGLIGSTPTPAPGNMGASATPKPTAGPTAIPASTKSPSALFNGIDTLAIVAVVGLSPTVRQRSKK
jgi:hypothetical protein